MDINEIMDMLDWKNDLSIQKEGRELAKGIKCLKIFMQPCDKLYNKNVWDNCALILQTKSDEELEPYFTDLVEWLQDMNWPGAEIILERLKKIRSCEKLSVVIQDSVKKAKACGDTLWLLGISELLCQDRIICVLPKEIVEILQVERDAFLN